MTIQEICERFNITNYTINPDDSIDVNGEVNLNGEYLTEFPLTFNRVSGNFYCSRNELTTLLGCPKYVGGSFNCSENKLTSLEGCPEKVDLWFDCSHNKLTTLEFGPKEVKWDFDCRHNNLTSLEGSPENIGGVFHCISNPISSISEEMDIDFIKAFNTFKVLKDNTINLKRLRYVMEMFNKPVDLDKIKKYYTIS